MKILLIGNVKFSEHLLQKLVAIKAPIAGIITKESSPFNADHCDLSALAKQYDVPCLYVADINAPASVQWAKTLDADTCYCFGFSQLLGREFLELFPQGTMGYHPAALPSNRGRHPIIWALVLGLKETASTFFYMTEAADAGDIISQVTVHISEDDDAQSLYDKLADTAARQLEEVFRARASGTIKRQPQALAQGNIWRRRTKDDGKIDFRMASRAIYNLVRGLTRPYAGAYACFKTQEAKVWKAREGSFSGGNIEPGKILKVEGREVLVKSYDGAIWLVEHDLKELPQTGEYFL